VAPQNPDFRLQSILQRSYLTTITGQDEWFTTPSATLPSNNFLNPVLPLVPNIIKSIFSLSANPTISPTIDDTETIVLSDTEILVFASLLFI
jgi:hypothetical protein